MTDTHYYIKLPDGSFVSFDSPYEYAMFSGTTYRFSELCSIFFKFAVFMICLMLLLWLVCLFFGLFV